MTSETPVYVPGYGEMTAGQVAEMVVSTENRVITTGEAAELFGYSSETVTEAAYGHLIPDTAAALAKKRVYG